MRRVLLAVLAAAGCASWREADDDEQRARAQSIRSAVETRGKPTLAGAAVPAVETAIAVAEVVGEKIQDAAPELAEKAEAVGESALQAAAYAAVPPAAVALAAVTTADVAVKAALAPVKAAGELVSNASDSISDALMPPPGSETMVRFQRSRSVKLTRREVERLLEDASEHRLRETKLAKEAAMVVAELAPDAEGAQDFLWDLLGSPYRDLREAAAGKLRAASR